MREETIVPPADEVGASPKQMGRRPAEVGAGSVSGDADAMQRVLGPLRLIARGDGPTPAMLRAWMRGVSGAVAAELLPKRARLPEWVARVLRDDIAHLLRRGTSSGAFRAGNEAAAVRFALEVAFLTVPAPVRPASPQPLQDRAGPDARPAPLFEERMLFLLRAWGHMGSLMRDGWVEGPDGVPEVSPERVQ